MSSNAQVSSKAASDAAEVYREYVREIDRLRRLRHADRDFATVQTLTTEEWALSVRELLTGAREYIDESVIPTEVTAEGRLLGDDTVELSVCLVACRDLLYVATGDHVGGGQRERFGFRVTMLLVSGSWRVHEERFQQRRCDELGIPRSQWCAGRLCGLGV